MDVKLNSEVSAVPRLSSLSRHISIGVNKGAEPVSVDPAIAIVGISGGSSHQRRHTL